MPSIPGVGGVDLIRGLVSLVALVAVVAVLASGTPVAPLELVAYVLAAAALVALAFDRVRERPWLRFAQTTLLALAIVLIYLAPPRTLFEGALALLAVLAVVADGYKRATSQDGGFGA